MALYNNAEQTPIRRVSSHDLCPICDKPDWCGVFEDGHAAICMRVESDRPTNNGGWLHILSDPVSPHRPTFTDTKQTKRATPDTLNDVYQTVFSHLSLTGQHRQDLIARGLTPEEIKTLSYVSLPEGLERAPLVNDLVERYDTHLLSVPGFYLTQSGHVWLAGPPGMLIPCRNVHGHLQGAQIRLDDSSHGKKYVWLSAGRKQRKRGGVSSGTPIHVAMPQADSTRVWITEGILKADIAALKLGETVIGVAGVASWNLSDIEQTLKALSPNEVVIAFDADADQNKTVKRQQKRLAKEIGKLGYRVLIANWDAELGKGIDDLLVAEQKPIIEPFCPAVNLDHLKASPKHGGVKRIRRRIITGESLPENEWELPIDHIRDLMGAKVENFVHNGEGQGLLLKVAAGIGKTTTSLDVVDCMYKADMVRPVYATVRHDLIDQHLPCGWIHLRPRKPQQKIWQEVAPDDGLIHIRETLNSPQFCSDDLDILCHHHKKADTLGGKRWNVPKNLCGSVCEIGTSLLGTHGCPYFRQYDQAAPLATVHETLFIPKFCEDIFGNPQLEFDSQKQVLIIDEPNPSKFIEAVEIKVSDLSVAIVQAWDDGLKELLELLRQTAESVARQDEKKRLLGRDAMEEIIDHVGGVEKFEQMLKNAKAEFPQTHETVVIAIDMFIGDTNKAWKVLIDGEVNYLPKQVADPIDAGSMKVAKWFAQKNELSIIQEFEAQENQVPLNFQSDLLTVLRREFQQYANGEAYNSALVIDPFKNEPTIRLNLRRYTQIPLSVPILLLDGQGDAKLLSRLLQRDVEEWKAPVGLKDTQIIQVVDGIYGVSSLWNKKQDKPKASFERLWDKIVSPLVDEHASEMVIITWKCVADYLRERQEDGELPEELAIAHYGNTEGSNEFEDRRMEILLGTPQANPADIGEMANALFISDDPIDMTRVKNWKPYNYVDCDGYGYEALVESYADERVEMLARIHREDELVQSAHRCRPMLHAGKTIIMLTHLPIDELPPTQLVTVDELAEQMPEVEQSSCERKRKLTKVMAQEVYEEIIESVGHIWLESFKLSLRRTFCNTTIGNIDSEGENRQCLCEFPSDATIRRWLIEFSKEDGLTRSAVVIERRRRGKGGGATWLYVYHCVELDEGLVREFYKEQLSIAEEDIVVITPVAYPDEGDDGVDWGIEVFVGGEKGRNSP